MAKTTSGLPEGFDISVSSADLTGPATIPGYLDEDPVVEFARKRREEFVVGTTPLASKNSDLPALESKPIGRKRELPPQKWVEAPIEQAPIIQSPPEKTHTIDKASEIRRRLQINLDVETDQMVEEILDLLSNQSSEHRIKVSELFQALLLNLYSAKGEIVLGSLPTRGRWGSPTARAFPVALSEAFREAILAHEKVSSGNPFKKAAGA